MRLGFSLAALALAPVAFAAGPVIDYRLMSEAS